MEMYTASLQGFFRTILIILLVYYGIKILARIFMPILMRKIVHKAHQNFQQQSQGFSDQHTTASNEAFENKKSKKQVGEYVDFEEIE